MSGFLLDVNVLIAMAWPTHVAHQSVHRWLGKNAKAGWATCPLTECAFIRLSSNPAFSPNALVPQQARALLEANLTHPAHKFWPDDLSVAESFEGLHGLTGHKQVTDAYLLRLAQRHRGTLATLDSGLAAFAESNGTRIEWIR